MSAVIIKKKRMPRNLLRGIRRKVFYLRNYIYEKSIVGDYRVSSSGRTGMAPWHVHT